MSKTHHAKKKNNKKKIKSLYPSMNITSSIHRQTLEGNQIISRDNDILIDMELQTLYPNFMSLTQINTSKEETNKAFKHNESRSTISQKSMIQQLEGGA